MDHIAPQIDVLIDAYIDQTMSDDQFDTLCAWLRDALENRQAFARRLALHSEIAEWCTEQSGSHIAGSLDTTDAEVDLPTLVHTPSTPPLTKQQYLSALSYVLHHTFTPKRVAYLSAAAALLLGVALTIVLLASPRTEQPLANNVEQQDQPPVVATLSGEHDAQWRAASGSTVPGIGAGLHPGQRLTLIEGLAQITTQRGALLVLEAPATVEMLDSDNAIRLHEGKLVGACLTQRSKGLIVRTPHTDITDLGTRFGVDVPDNQQTQIQVIEGSIELSMSNPDSAQHKLEAGEAVVADGKNNPQPIALAPNTFVTDRELAVRQDAADSARARSLALRYERARAGDVVLDLLFNQEAAGQISATSIANHVNPIIVNAADLVPGRFGEPTAVRLNDKDHFIQTTLDEPMQTVTIAGWYYIEELDRLVTSLCHSNAFTSLRDDNAYGLHWHLTKGKDQTATIGLVQARAGAERRNGDARSTPIDRERLTNQWIHLAVTLDADTGKIVLYLNGQPIADHQANNLVPIRLGELQIGNWHPMNPIAPQANPLRRSLHGSVDGFVVLNRSLSSEELLELYQSELP